MVCHHGHLPIRERTACLLSEENSEQRLGWEDCKVNNQWRLTSIGVMPRAYVELSNQTVMLFPDAYTETTATLIEDTIQDSSCGVF